MKKLIILSTILFIFFISSPNVFAYQLPTAYTGVDYVDDTYQDGNTNVASWWGTDNYLASPFRLGYFTPATAEAKKIQFLWSNLNLCPNQNLKITGKIGALFNFFTENPYTISVFNNNQEMTCSFSLDESSRISYTCVGVGGGNFYIALSQLNFASHNNYEVGVSRDVDYSCEVTNLQVMQQEIINTQNIINSQNSNTNQIIQNQDSNTQDIIDNQNSNTQDIIDNQNQNTQQQIESQQVCSYIDKAKITTDNNWLDQNGGMQPSNNFGITDYINLTNKDKLIKVNNISSSTYTSFCFYNINKELISCLNNYSTPVNTNIDIPQNTSYIRFSINKEQNKPQFNICVDGNQALSDDINNLNDTLKDTSTPNTSQDISDMNDMVASDTPISDLITMPLTLFNSYINGINATCSPFNIGNLYGTDIVFPCLNLDQRLGSNLWGTIDAFFSIFMCYNIGMLFITAFDGLTSLRDDFEGLYQPRHADSGYQPKHGGGN